MAGLTKKQILKMAEEQKVKFVRLQFTDILGIVKNVAITVDQLEDALDGKIMFDGSSIEGFVRIQESDMYLKPDYDTYTLFPWSPQGEAVARLICDVYDAEGRPFAGCPRGILRRALAEAEALGYELKVGPEPEFFLFETDEEGYPLVKVHDHAGYFDLAPADRGEEARREIVLALEAMGFKIETSHHEVAPSQHEIDFKYTNALTTADNIVTFRFVTKIIAQRFGLCATFMPKPVYGQNGSGMHLHQSLFRGETNLFYDPENELGLSELALHYIGGILTHAKALAAVTNPCVNSYKRLVPGYEAPVYLSWSAKNRSALIRIPAARGLGTRIELRNPDPTANPYLALAVILKAGLDGIKNKIDPGPQRFNNIFEMTAAERQAAGIESLPGSLREALDYLERDPLLRETLGEHVYTNYLRAKELEWDEYRTQVHDWEIKRYLQVY
ncbi:MAG TPA: type I glutamate--ammonia ligase [Firmicutes bacterium]|nr:type I glutamate--ammonia ligase [Bacillota bacterium]